ncbi:MAG: ATP-grasp domain-containing protein [Lachnospiraceae bacterium]|nr:ATP-grasp domain-containing protein [Lachnospiraceae bacterium]
MKKKILITAGGTGSAWQIAETIKKYYSDSFELFITDTNEKWLVASAALADHFFTVPPVKSRGYAAYMYDLIEKNGIDIIIPLIPWEQRFFAPDNKHFAALGIVSTAPLTVTEELLNDKNSLYGFCVSNKIPTVRIVDIKDVSRDKTYFIKSSCGFGSMGAGRVSGSDILKMDKKEIASIVIQEDCTGKGTRKGAVEEVTAECFYDGRKCHVAVRERLEAKSGVCTKAGFRNEPEIEETINKICEMVEMPKVFNIQFIRKGKKWLVMDVNLRLAAGTGLSAAAGFDVVRALLADLSGKKVNPKWLKIDPSVETVLRVYREVTIKK